MSYVNAECDDCGFFGLCIIDGDACYCDACFYGDDDDSDCDDSGAYNHGIEDCDDYPEDYMDQFDDDYDAMAEEFDDVYGDDFNDIAQGRYDDGE